MGADCEQFLMEAFSFFHEQQAGKVSRVDRDISKSYDVESNKKLPRSDAQNTTENIQKSAIKESKTITDKRQLSKSNTIAAKIKLSSPHVPKVSQDTKRPIEKDPEIKSDILKPSIVSTISR